MSGEEKLPEKMDRKTAGRMPSVPQKNGNGTDNAATNSNKFPQRNRRREGAQSGPRPRSENQATYRRTPNKFNDKRPRSKGFINDRQREEVTEGLRAEHGSVLRMGAKKTNLNHLLNFSVGHGGEHFDSRVDSHQASGYRGGGRNRKWSRKPSVRYNKEQFLQANCQFVVKESGSYTVNTVDPDILVDWDLIEQVKIFGNQVPSCPICLYPPVAAKITRCGHIYCWTCMLHYLSLSDKKSWSKCPICYEAVHQKDLKSVVALETHSYNVGDDITMSLMKREKGSTYTVPANQWTARENKPHNVDDPVDLCFSKLLVASPDQVQMILDTENTALDTQMADNVDTLEGSYIHAALDLLKERQVNVRLAKAAKESIHEKLEALSQQKPKCTTHKSGSTFAPLRRDIVEYTSAFSDEEVSKLDTESDSHGEIEGAGLPVVQSAPNLESLERTTSESSDDICGNQSPREPFNSTRVHVVSVAKGDGQNVEVNIEEVAEDLTLPMDENVSSKDEKDQADKAYGNDAFYFYQASDGQQIYLNSINARCLVKEYGSLSKCPQTITARVVEFEGISMNEELRSRLRYLNHLPLTCEFKVAELAIKPPILSKKTIDFYSDEIAKKKRLRQRKQRDEKRQLKKMHEKQCRKYENVPEMRALISNSQPFPESGTKIVQSEMPNLLAKSESETPDETPVGSPTDVAAVDEDDGQTGMSFAQMLRAGKMKTPGWPRVGKQEPDVLSTTQKAGSDSENEDRVPVPIYQESFGDAIEKALNNYTKSPDAAVGDSATPDPGGATGKGKKKKKQKKLLFTNTMARAK